MALHPNFILMGEIACLHAVDTEHRLFVGGELNAPIIGKNKRAAGQAMGANGRDHQGTDFRMQNRSSRGQVVSGRTRRRGHNQTISLQSNYGQVFNG